MPISKNVNKDFFKVWTSNMAYVVGFFAADGYVTINKRGGHFWCIQIADFDLLNQIRDVVGSNHKITMRSPKGNEKQLYRLQIGSKEMCNDLSKIGIRYKKTKTMKFPPVPDKFLNDFIRGYFDGDGHIWVGYPYKHKSISISVGFTSSSEDFLKGLRCKLIDLGLIGGSLICRETYFRLQYSVNDSVRLYGIMYNNIGIDLYLSRKRIVFDKYINIKNAPVV